VHASIIDMTLRLPVDRVLFDELRTDFLPKASQHQGFRGFQYVLAEQGRAVGILWYEQPEDHDGITRLAGTWFQDHIAPRLAEPETAVSGHVVVNMTPPARSRDLTAPGRRRSPKRVIRHAIRPRRHSSDSLAQETASSRAPRDPPSTASRPSRYVASG
jgi:hypothetical protein